LAEPDKNIRLKITASGKDIAGGVFVLTRKRIKWIYGFICLLGALLILRLGYVQLYDGPRSGAGLRMRAAEQWKYSIVTEEYMRGEILDRNMRSMTDSGVESRLVAFPSAMLNPEDARSALDRLDRLDAETKKALLQWADGLQNQRTVSKMVRYPGSLAPEILLDMEKASIPGLAVIPMKIRYGAHSVAKHVVGYMNRVDRRTWEKLEKEHKTEGSSRSPKAYGADDFIGVTGLEKQYEDWLRGGIPRQNAMGVSDAAGGVLPGFIQWSEAQADPYRNDIVLTLDRNIQEKLESAMDKTMSKGAAVILSVESGHVLAMASRPDFDQNRIADYLTAGDAFISKADQARFYPGSVFKVVTAAAALEAGLISPETRFSCPGYYEFPDGTRIGCSQAHGEITMEQAFAQSCNTAFVRLGLQMGAEQLDAMARRMMMPARLNKEAPAALVGNTAIGQEGVQVSPLQLARLMGDIARGGMDKAPKIVSSILDHQGHAAGLGTAPEEGGRVLTPEIAQRLKAWLLNAVREGTGKDAWVEPWGAAGKTGTSQVNAQGRVIAWFAGYFPAENPVYAAAVMVEEDLAGQNQGLRGGKEAVQVFRDIVLAAASTM
jgi:penicillin-binding protein 2